MEEGPSKHTNSSKQHGSIEAGSRSSRPFSEPYSNKSTFIDRGAQTTSEDLRSLCGSLSDVFTRSLSYFSPNSSSANQNSYDQETANLTLAPNPHGYGRSFFETAQIVQTNAKSKVSFDRNNEVQELYTMGTVASFDKQSQRGTTNPWRKYGALRKLHEIGGSAPAGNTKFDRKNKDGFVTIKKGTKPPPPPRCPEVTLNKDKQRPGIIGRIRLPKNVPAEQLSQAIAWEIKAMVEKHPKELESVEAVHTDTGLDEQEKKWQNMDNRRQIWKDSH